MVVVRFEVTRGGQGNTTPRVRVVQKKLLNIYHILVLLNEMKSDMV
jgi:hypothetical protein